MSGKITNRQALADASEVSEFLGIPITTLAQWRYLRRGPRSIKVGRHVRYRWADVERWLDEQSRGAA